MTTRTWTHDDGYYRSLTDPWDWSPYGTPLSGDTLIMRYGTGQVSTSNALWNDQLYVGSFMQSSPVHVVFANAAAQLNFGAAPSDGPRGPITHRYADVTAIGNSVLNLQGGTGIYGGSTVHLTVPAFSNLVAMGTLTDNISLSIQGVGTITNVGMSMSRADAVVSNPVIGTGAWNLYGNDNLLFLGSVGSGQMVNIAGISNLNIEHSTQFAGAIASSAAAPWTAGQIALNGVHADAASFAADMLHLSYQGQATEDVHLALHQDWQAFATATGVLILPGTNHATPAGDTHLLTHYA